MANDSHYPGGVSKPAQPSFKEKITGPVPMHHRARLGATDLQSNPQGAGPVSKRPTVANGQGKNY